MLDDYRTLLLKQTPLLDVRAPVEFSKGAFPASINLPLMSDEERHLVGLQYKQHGQLSAIELGAQLVTPELREQRVAGWIELIQQNPDTALYCFRGGLRSRIAQLWLKEAGVEIPLIKGGYKALRSYLIQQLESLCLSTKFTLIGGKTGNGKTLLLKELGQMIDLEGLANHRGSSFGSMFIAQPSNIDFENALTVELMRFDMNGVRAIYLEDEARLIGRVCLPDTLRSAMESAPIVILECSMQERIRHCFDDYVTDLLSRYQLALGVDEGFQAYCEHHRSSLSRIKKRFGLERYQHALTLLEDALARHSGSDDTSGYADFIELLLCEYYDPMYDYQLSKKIKRIVFKGTAEDILEWNREQ